MKETYSIGEHEPWRLTKESGYRLAMAICQTNAEVICAHVDNYLPPTHECIRLKLDPSKVPVFRKHFKSPLDPVEVAMGQYDKVTTFEEVDGAKSSQKDRPT